MTDIVKQTLSMRNVAEQYGFELERGSFIKCPFHSEKTASLKIYSEPGRGWHCYGCGTGGSVIDFVMLLFEIPFSAALVRLNSDFQLGLTADKPDPTQLNRLRRDRAERDRKKRAWEEEYRTKTDEFRRLHIYKTTSKPDSPEYAEACGWKYDYLDWWLEKNLSYRG